MIVISPLYFFKEFKIMLSLKLSMLLVGSSNNKSLGFLKNTLASQRRCFSPRLILVLSSLITVSSPFSKLKTKS